MKPALILAFAILGTVVGAAPARAQDWRRAIDAESRGDYATELKILQPLADRGDPDGQLLLGYMYFYGRGMPVDMVTAKNWFTRAAEQNDGHAQYELSDMAYYGWGGPIDYEEAYFWISLAAQTRSGPEGMDKLALLNGSKTKLTAEQRSSVDNKVAAWRDRHPLPPDMLSPGLAFPQPDNFGSR